MKAKRINALYVVLCIILIFCIVLGVTNIENLEKSSLIDPDYVENAVGNMRRNYIILGNGWSNETAEMYESIYAKDVTSGNACIVGFVIAGVSVFALVVCFFMQMQVKTIEQREEQTAILSTLVSTSEQSLESRLTELQKLKDKGLITDDEYKCLREKALNE